MALLASPLPLDASACWLDVRVDGRVLPFDHHAPGVVVAWPDRAAEKPACPVAADEALGDHERRDQMDTVAPSPVH